MTSSLVGSEMCIRDSPKVIETDQEGGIITETAKQIFSGLGIQLKEKGVGSVSYTHLTLPTICSV
eukprot:9982543-Prorocentrum_lima.AAC.1